MLSDAKVRNAKPGEKPCKLFDGGGLHLLVTPTGSKLWRQAYRRPADKKPDTLAHGSYPDVSLSAARKKRDAALSQIRDGIDPKAARKAEKAQQAIRSANTFGVIADELLDKKRREGKASATLRYYDYLLSLALPALESRPIAEITAPEILIVLRDVERRKLEKTPQCLRAVIGEVFRHAVATGRASGDPTVALRGALARVKPTPRAAIIEPKAFGGLLRSIAGYEGMPETRIALQLIALTFVRPGELCAAEWSEIDLEARTWSIPAARTKKRRPHRVPLSQQAIALLEELRALTGHRRLLFPGLRNPNHPMSAHTLPAALRNLGYPNDVASAHGFRASASTLLNEARLWSHDAIERQLAHIDQSATRAAYARGDHWDERVQMMQWWADKCDALRDGGEVVPFPTRAAQ